MRAIGYSTALYEATGRVTNAVEANLIMAAGYMRITVRAPLRAHAVAVMDLSYDVVRTVAERFVIRRFAAAEIECARGRRLERERIDA